MALLKCPDCLNDVSDTAPSCPKCGRTLAAGKTVRVRKSEFLGVGCLVQGLGLLAPLLLIYVAGPIGGAVGFVVLLALLIAGRQLSSWWACGRCGAKLPGKEATSCATCRSEFLPLV